MAPGRAKADGTLRAHAAIGALCQSGQLQADRAQPAARVDVICLRVGTGLTHAVKVPAARSIERERCRKIDNRSAPHSTVLMGVTIMV